MRRRYRIGGRSRSRAPLRPARPSATDGDGRHVLVVADGDVPLAGRPRRGVARAGTTASRRGRAADGGLARAGRSASSPTLLVGDLDSLDPAPVAAAEASRRRGSSGRPDKDESRRRARAPRGGPASARRGSRCSARSAARASTMRSPTCGSSPTRRSRGRGRAPRRARARDRCSTRPARTAGRSGGASRVRRARRSRCSRSAATSPGVTTRGPPLPAARRAARHRPGARPVQRPRRATPRRSRSARGRLLVVETAAPDGRGYPRSHEHRRRPATWPPRSRSPTRPAPSTASSDRRGSLDRRLLLPRGRHARLHHRGVPVPRPPRRHRRPGRRGLGHQPGRLRAATPRSAPSSACRSRSCPTRTTPSPSAYGAWREKQNYGKTYMGIVRSSFLVEPDGRIAKAWPNVKADGHADEVRAALESARAGRAG